jgi:Na+/H+-translocating membrane pyrophosphatase
VEKSEVVAEAADDFTNTEVRKIGKLVIGARPPGEPHNQAYLLFPATGVTKLDSATQALHALPTGDTLTVNLAELEESGLIVKNHTTALQTKDGFRQATMPDFVRLYNVTLMNPKVLVGIFMGVMLAFVFCAMTMKAVGRSAASMVEEVRRQFREIPGIMEGEGTPDYAACVAISTAAAQREMIVPALLGLIVPILVGLVLGVGGVMGMLTGGLTSGFAVAIMMSNAGGAWDNAKKYIEAGAHGGKGTDAHKATVVGDTVGDPFKDTSGPSLNILIKLMSMVSVVFAGLVVQYALTNFWDKF